MRKLFRYDFYNNIELRRSCVTNFSEERFMRKIMLLSFFVFCMHTSLIAQFQYTVTLTGTLAPTPANPKLSTYLSSGNVRSTVTYINPNPIDSFSNVRTAYIFGSIQDISSDFTITTRISNQSYQLSTGKSVNIVGNQVLNAFGNLTPNNVIISGQGSANIDQNNIILPSGTYRICFFAATTNDCIPTSQCLLSDPNAGSGCATFTINCNPTNGAQINTIAKPQLNPAIAQSIQLGEISSTIQFNSSVGCNTNIELIGKIERMGPSPFKITLSPNYITQKPVLLIPGVTQLNSAQLAEAFGNFSDANLVTEGIELASVKDPNNNIRLPDGNYRICFYARYINRDGSLGENASDPNLGCGTFTICGQSGGAPQFTQPINNLNINSSISIVQPASPVIFTWTPPQFTCGLPPGGVTYDFDIWELFSNQNVDDAVNNPFVFHKVLLPSATFLLDTNLYKNVLQEGKRYAVRVRAVVSNINASTVIDNNGYSRIEAFQYGGNLITQNGISDPQDYYIQFEERRGDFWDDYYHAYKNHQHGDTLVPVKEYIAFALAENETAYSLDAIELFLALNPELAELKKVKISYTPRLPIFPVVAENDIQNFNKEHQVSLEPNSIEKNKFLNYLDTLNNYKQKIPDTTARLIDELINHLNNVKGEIDSVDRVSVSYINMTLSELLYELRVYPRNMSASQYKQVKALVSTLMELTTESLSSTAFIYQILLQKKSSLSSYIPVSRDDAKKLSRLNNPLKYNESDSIERLLAVIIKQLLPFDVIVWRTSNVAPYKPVLDAPDLIATYRIFYTLSNLYNAKNPEINAKSTSRLASTVQVSLPSNTHFTFWTLNMLNHKMTKGEDVDLKGVLSHTNKMPPGIKKPSIVLKVE